ncbi:MAG: M23 family metallopeptidase [Synechococcales bacterium]|nr:M23 family metallopeptidase [Synechococcales bacterium]
MLDSPMKYVHLVLIALSTLALSLLLGGYQSQWNPVWLSADQGRTVQVRFQPAAVEQPETQTWLLELPRYWVANGACQLNGSITTLLTQEGRDLHGTLPWVWNGQDGSAAISGNIGSRRTWFELTPPAVGGFPMRFQGQLGEPNQFSGAAVPQGICRGLKDDFKLTRLPKMQKPPEARTLALFRKPFDGEFLLSNYFDHDVPRQFVDNNGYMLNWRGDRLAIGSPGAGIDGHGGYDWGLPENMPLRAVADGTITFAGEGRPFYCPPLDTTTTGQYVYIEHTTSGGDRFESEYVHLNRVDVQTGDWVQAGQVIGLSGNTGCSTGPHLHFGVRRLLDSGEKVLVDPYGWAAYDADPWRYQQRAADSLWLWQEGQAPALFEFGRKQMTHLRVALPPLEYHPPLESDRPT